MDNNQGMMSTALGCWLVAGLVGLLTAVLLWVLGGWGFIQGAFMGIVVCAVVGGVISWIMTRPLPAPGEVVVGTTATQAAKPSAPAAASAAVASTSASASATAQAEIKPSTQLKGQQDLSARKGEWKYEGEAKAPANAKAAPAKKAAAQPAEKKPAAKKTAEKKTAAAEPAAKKTAVAEPAAKKPAAKKTAAAKPAAKKPAAKAVAADGKPEMLSAPRASGADDLKLISGVGPKIEQTLNELGVYHYDQVADWRKKEIEWVDERLRFKGRIERDGWIAQAKTLAKGGETEFSKRKKKT